MDLYETEMDLNLRLQTLQAPANDHQPASQDTTLSSRESQDTTLSSRESHHDVTFSYIAIPYTYMDLSALENKFTARFTQYSLDFNNYIQTMNFIDGGKNN